MNELNKSDTDLKEFRILALLVLAFTTLLALTTASQLPLDLHSFRQTQTGLTAFWMMKNGFNLSYETPVVGAPWSIPFEFPIYQALVALISKNFDLPLHVVGRLVSFTFLVLCLFPVKGIIRKLDLPEAVFYIFSCLFLSAPIYVYWGRAFLMETFGLFFAVSAIYFFIKCITEGYHLTNWILLAFSLLLSLLQKATTGLPVAIVLFCSLLVFEKKLKLKLFVKAFVLFGLPVLITYFWINFTDQVKLLNPIGHQLTSSALTKWNWGTWNQRLSLDLWKGVIWDRIFSQNLGNLIGLLLLGAGLIWAPTGRVRTVLVISLALGLLPLFLFTNVHIGIPHPLFIHDYYQTANLIFFTFSLAVSLGVVLMPRIGRKKVLYGLTVILGINLFCLSQKYLPWTQIDFSKFNSPDYLVGHILKRELSEQKQFVAFGNLWSSTFAYMAERKACTIEPNWYQIYPDFLTHPENCVEPGHLGAVVTCSTNPSVFDLLKLEVARQWKVGESLGCFFAIPEKPFTPPAKTTPLNKNKCNGAITDAQYVKKDKTWVLLLKGWSVLQDQTGEKKEEPDQVVIRLSKKGMQPVYLDALKIPHHPALNVKLRLTEDWDLGFSRAVAIELNPGDYEIGLFQIKGNRQEFCTLPKWSIG